MTDEERDQANVALMLDKQITERVLTVFADALSKIANPNVKFGDDGSLLNIPTTAENRLVRKLKRFIDTTVGPREPTYVPISATHTIYDGLAAAGADSITPHELDDALAKETPDD